MKRNLEDEISEIKNKMVWDWIGFCELITGSVVKTSVKHMQPLCLNAYIPFLVSDKLCDQSLFIPLNIWDLCCKFILQPKLWICPDIIILSLI